MVSCGFTSKLYTKHEGLEAKARPLTCFCLVSEYILVDILLFYLIKLSLTALPALKKLNFLMKAPFYL